MPGLRLDIVCFYDVTRQSLAKTPPTPQIARFNLGNTHIYQHNSKHKWRNSTVTVWWQLKKVCILHRCTGMCHAIQPFIQTYHVCTFLAQPEMILVSAPAVVRMSTPFHYFHDVVPPSTIPRGCSCSQLHDQVRVVGIVGMHMVDSGCCTLTGG